MSDKPGSSLGGVGLEPQVCTLISSGGGYGCSCLVHGWEM